MSIAWATAHAGRNQSDAREGLTEKVEGTIPAPGRKDRPFRHMVMGDIPFRRRPSPAVACTCGNLFVILGLPISPPPPA